MAAVPDDSLAVFVERNDTSRDVLMKLAQRFLPALPNVGNSHQLLLSDASGVERTHRKLRARLADGLRGDDAHRDPGSTCSPVARSRP